MLVTTQDREAVITALAVPETQIVSCRAADGSLDPNLAAPDSFYAIVARGLRRRYDAGLSGLTLLSCDNLAENGRQLRSLMTAYLGLARGNQFVHKAIADPELSALVVALMRSEAAPTLDVVPGLDLDTYADSLVKRFANGALPHRVVQVAMDGSQKIPQPWLEPLAINQAQGRFCPATLQALATWIVHVRGAARTVDDPMAADLASLWTLHGEEGISAALFGEAGLFSATWTATIQDMVELNRQISNAFV